MNEIILDRPVKSVFIPLENRISSFADKSDIELQIKEKCEKSYNEGYEDGVAEGQRVQEAVSGVEIQQLKQNFQKVVKSLPHELKKAFMDVEDLAAALCLKMAKKVIHKEIESKDHIINLIRDIIKDISDKTTLTLRMNPDDLRMLREEGLELELAKDVTTLNIVEDMEIQRGGCIIEHNLGQVNAKIEDQIAALDNTVVNKFTEADKAAEEEKQRLAKELAKAEAVHETVVNSAVINEVVAETEAAENVDISDTNAADIPNSADNLDPNQNLSSEVTQESEENTPNVDLGTDNANNTDVDISGTALPS